MDPTSIKEALMIDERKLQEQMLSRVAVHLGFDSSGRVIIRNRRGYRQKDLIPLYLLGVRDSADVGLRPSDRTLLSEVSESLGIQCAPAAAPSPDLKAG